MSLCVHLANREVLGPSVAGAPSGSEERGCGCLNNCRTRLLLQPQGGPIQGFSHRCTPPHPDTLHAGILAHTASSCLPEQRERHHARTLCSTVGLLQILLSFSPLTVGSVVIPPPPSHLRHFCYWCINVLLLLLPFSFSRHSLPYEHMYLT